MEPALKGRLTPEEYLAFERTSEEKHEYLDGEIVAMSGGSANHSLIQANLTRVLGNQVLDRPCVVFSSDMRVLIEGLGLYTYPDLSVVCEERIVDENDNLLNPTVVVEVLSPTTEAYDRGRKFDMYATLESLQHYVLVAQDEARVHVYTRQPNGAWLRTVATGLDGRISLDAISCELVLAEVYRDVVWEAATKESDAS